MITLATLVVSLRVWTRLGIQRMGLGADDWWILASWLFSLAFIVNICTQTSFGLGKHVYDLPPTTNFTASLELFYFGEATYYIGVGLTKISILFLYLRLIPQRGYRIVIWTCMAFVAATIFSTTVAGLFQCNPVHKAWDTQVPGTCFNQVALYLSNAALNIVQDVLIYFLPIKMLWNIQLPRKQRIALMAVFAIGGFVCVTGMLRLNSLKLASVSADPTWDNFGAAIWSAIEMNVGIVCASLVHFKALIARFFPSLLGIQRSSHMIKLGDKPSDASGSRSFGRSKKSASGKPFGILTELELEEGTNEGRFDSPASYGTEAKHLEGNGVGAGNVHAGGFGAHNASDEHLTTGQGTRKPSAIYKSTSVTVSYD